MKPNTMTGTSATVIRLGLCVEPARLSRAATIDRHHVLQDALVLARRLMMPCSRLIWAVVAGSLCVSLIEDGASVIAGQSSLRDGRGDNRNGIRPDYINSALV